MPTLTCCAFNDERVSCHIKAEVAVHREYPQHIRCYWASRTGQCITQHPMAWKGRSSQIFILQFQIAYLEGSVLIYLHFTVSYGMFGKFCSHISTFYILLRHVWNALYMYIFFAQESYRYTEPVTSELYKVFILYLDSICSSS